MRVFEIGIVAALATMACAGEAPRAFDNQPAQADSKPLRQTRSFTRSTKRSVWVIHHQLVTKILGLAVENRDGQYLGKVDDFIVDSQSGQVTFVVVSCRRGLSLTRKLKAAPARLLSTATAKEGVAALDAGRRHWERGPVFKRSDLAKLAEDPDAAEALYRYYGLSSANSATVGVATNSPGLPPVGRSERVAQQQRPVARPRRTVRRLEFARSFIGKTVTDRQGQRLGEISDLLIDLNGQKPTLAILIPAKTLNQSGRFALAFFSLNSQPDGRLRIDASSKSFANAPPLDDSAWQTARDREGVIIYRFSTGESASSEGQTLKARGTRPVGFSASPQSRLCAQWTPETLDAAIIMSAQKMEHYEICAYGSMATWAGMLGRQDIKTLRGQTLQEEARADEKLTELAKAGINQRSAERSLKAA